MTRKSTSTSGPRGRALLGLLRCVAGLGTICLLAACGQRPGVHLVAAPPAGLTAARTSGQVGALNRPMEGELGDAPVPAGAIGRGSPAPDEGAGVIRFSRAPQAAPTGAPLVLRYVRTFGHSGSQGDAGANPLATCPVVGPVHGWDSFGAPRFAGGYHPHAGIDVMAPEGAPIVAPFPGFAVATPNRLGGNAVEVIGGQGFVYNAHLSRYGRLGRVQTGDVIGYVGNTGDARGGPPHDHFEWHPNVMPSHPWVSPYGDTTIGGAVDPFVFLREVCR